MYSDNDWYKISNNEYSFGERFENVIVNIDGTDEWMVEIKVHILVWLRLIKSVLIVIDSEIALFDQPRNVWMDEEIVETIEVAIGEAIRQVQSWVD